MGWVRRHPFATAIFVLLFAFFALAALIGDTEERGNAILGLALIYVGIVAIYAFCSWLYGKTIGRKRQEPAIAPTPYASPSPQAFPSAVPPPSSLYSSPTEATMPFRPMETFAPPSASRAVPVLAPTIGDLLTLTPTQFEEVTLRLLVAMGYTDSKRSGGSGDLGADVVCRDPQGRSTIVQCKRYAPGSNIGTPVIQTFIGMKNVHHQADRGIFVTTVTYSQPAIDLARQHGIALIDGQTFLLLAHLTGIPLAETVNQTAPCPRCGTANPITDQFCAACGAPLATASDAVTSPQSPFASEQPVQANTLVECPRCHTQQSASARYCTNCGLPRSTVPR